MGRPAATNLPAFTPGGRLIRPDTTASSTGPSSIELSNSGALSEDSLVIGKIKLTADTRTNRIHVVTRTANLAFVHELIKELDVKRVHSEP